MNEHRRPVSALLALLSLAVSLVMPGCSQARTSLPAEVVAELDIANNAIADLTDDGGEQVPRPELMQAVLRAQAAGTTLRVVVAPVDGELVSARGIVDRYGGTAISYQAGRTSFEGASRDMSSGQLERAVDAAKLEFDIGDSAAAFVDVIETEGLEEPGRSLTRTLLLLLLIPAAAFMVSGAWSYVQARRRRERRREKLIERKALLIEWAALLGPELEALRPAVASSSDPDAQHVWQESQDFVASIGSTLESARTISELDVAEMRIGRTAIKLRDLRRSLEPT